MKKGFTLIELLATLTIILLIATLVVPNLMKMSEDVRQNQYEAQIELILSAAREYGEDYINDLSNSCRYVTVTELIDEGYLKGESTNKTVIKDPRDKDQTLNNLEVCVKYNAQYTNETSKTFFKVTAELKNN